MPEGLKVMSMADALAAAQAEGGEATPPVTETGMPPVEVNAEGDGEKAPAASPEQPAAELDGLSEEAQTLGDALIATTEESQNGSDPAKVTPGSEDFWNLGVDVQTVNGSKTVTIKELSDGYLRQADYTQKTQNLAEMRKHAERSITFLEAFEGDPAGFARNLAVKAGLIEEGDVPVREIELLNIPTQEELDTKVNEMVEERIGKDERVLTAEAANARIQIDVEFDRIAKNYDIELKSELREDILKEAFRTGSSDLEGILAKRIASHQRKQLRADAASLASTSRPGGVPVGSTTADADKPVVNPSMAQAFDQAKKDLAVAQQ